MEGREIEPFEYGLKNCHQSFTNHSQLLHFVVVIPKTYIIWGPNFLFDLVTLGSRFAHRSRCVYRQKLPRIFYIQLPTKPLSFADSKNILIIGLGTLKACARSVHAVQSVHRVCTAPIGCLDPMLCMFLESAQQMQSF